MYKMYFSNDCIGKEFPYKNTASKIARDMGVVGRIRLISHYSNVREYRADKSGYKFCIIEVY